MPTRERFTVFFHNESIIHLQKNIGYYNLQHQGLGKRFGKAVHNAAKVLEKNPFFQIRYDDIRCLLVEKFPFMVHFSLDEGLKSVHIYAVLHTSLNPEEHWR